MKKVLLPIVFLIVSFECVCASAYSDNGDGTVSDYDTGLMWQQSELATLRTWDEALIYCNGLSLADHNNWRLPNIKELTSIIDKSRRKPSIAPVFTNVQSTNYWSSSPRINNETSVWQVSFLNGYITKTKKTNISFVRCVR